MPMIERARMSAVPGEKLVVVPGDTVRVYLTVDYRGPAIAGAVWTAIGFKYTGWFDEIFTSRTPISFLESYDFVPYDIVCDVLITDKPGVGFDMYAKIMEVPGPDIFTPTYEDVIDVLVPVEFQNFTIDRYEKVS